jgi:hypothetical protein
MRLVGPTEAIDSLFGIGAEMSKADRCGYGGLGRRGLVGAEDLVGLLDRGTRSSLYYARAALEETFRQTTARRRAIRRRRAPPPPPLDLSRTTSFAEVDPVAAELERRARLGGKRTSFKDRVRRRVKSLGKNK